MKNKMNGIMFTEPLFHAIVEGRKTQTRRVIKPPKKALGGVMAVKNHTGYIVDICWADENENWTDKHGNNNVIKPRYKVGDTVYLKEPYCFDKDLNNSLMYRYLSGIYGVKKSVKWKNKLFMPAKYARYFIEITDIKIECLQDISDEDCGKEGIFYDLIETDYSHYYDWQCRFYCWGCEKKGRKRLIKEALENREIFGFNKKWMDDEWIEYALDYYSFNDCCNEEAKTCDICGKDLSGYRYSGNSKCFYSPRQAYAALIDKINGKGTWDRNPYVWVYDFKLVK